MITFHHFGMLSTNPEASRQMLEALGYQMQGPIEDPLQNVRAYLGTHPSNPTVEIISPTDTPGPVTTLARRIHQGVYHLCFEVSDVAAFVEQFSVHGRVMEVSPPKPAILFGNRKISFYVVENFGLVELLERA
jgi:methylmalonyl-CoA/ethylmalonyl-CoA epimerase